MLDRIIDSGSDLYQRPEVVEVLKLPPGVPGPGCGLPIGNLTSQWWANHDLSDLDHYILRDLRVPYTQRYMDDATLFAHRKEPLERAREAIITWLKDHRRLTPKDPDARVLSTRQPLVYLGYRVDRHQVCVSQERLRRAKKRLAEVARRNPPERIERSLASYRGWVRFPASVPKST